MLSAAELLDRLLKVFAGKSKPLEHAFDAMIEVVSVAVR